MKEEIKRKYWSVGQASNELNVTVNIIRIWSDTFNVGSKRNQRNERRFDFQQFCRLKVIYILLYVEGYTYKGVKQQLEIV